MTGVILAACAAVLMAGAWSLWQRQRSRRRLGGHSSALLDLGRVAEKGGYPPDRPAAPTRASTAPPAPSQPAPAGPRGTTPPAPTGGWTAPPPAPPSLQSTTAGYGRGRTPPSWRRPRAVFALAGLGMAAVAAVALIAAAATSGSHRIRRAATARPAPSAPTRTSTPSTTVAPTTTTTAPAPAAPGGPVLSSISPSSGSPGQTVTLTGSNLFSPSGLITVTFGGIQAGVSCPSSTTCVATVPSGLTPSPSIPVVINTGTGASAAVPFSYP